MERQVCKRSKLLLAHPFHIMEWVGGKIDKCMKKELEEVKYKRYQIFGDKKSHVFTVDPRCLTDRREIRKVGKFFIEILKRLE